MLQCLKAHKVPYSRRAKAEEVVKASNSLCQEASNALEQEPTRDFGGLEEMLDNVLQELVLVRMNGGGQSEEEAKKFYDSDVQYDSNFSDLSKGEGEELANTERKRKSRKARIKRKPGKAKVTNLT